MADNAPNDIHCKIIKKVPFLELGEIRDTLHTITHKKRFIGLSIAFVLLNFYFVINKYINIPRKKLVMGNFIFDTKY